MRLLPGQPKDIAGQSITSYSLIAAALSDPDVLTRVWQVYREDDGSPLSAILSSKGYFTKGIKDEQWDSKFRVVSSNHVLYPIASTMLRKPKIVANADGVTFISDAYPTTPGYRGSVFYLFLDSNWIRPHEVFELNDNRTQLFVYDHNEPVEVDGGFRYEVKLVTKSRDAFVDTDMLTEGSEVSGGSMTAYEQDFSETGSEKYAFNGWGHSYMNLQRVKMSFSGTAKAMKTKKAWYEFTNSKGAKVNTYIEEAERLMYKRAAQYHEYQIIFGKGTVDEDGKVFLTNKKGRDVMMGDGLLYGGDGAIDRPFTHRGWTMDYLKNLIRDTDIRAGANGHKEAVLVGGYNNIASFNELMMDRGYTTKDNNVEGSGSDKGVNLNYKYIDYMDVRIYFQRYRWFDSPERPTKYMSNGQSRGSWDGFLVPLGLTAEGEKNIELVQLRNAVKGEMHGMDQGGPNMAHSVDGGESHFLWQTGVINRTNIFRLYMPYAA